MVDVNYYNKWELDTPRPVVVLSWGQVVRLDGTKEVPFFRLSRSKEYPSMPKPEKVRNPSAAPRDRNNGVTQTYSERDLDDMAGLSSLQASIGRDQQASLAFGELLQRNDGWLRCIPCGEGKVNYFKWKFNAGTHAGKYVMFVGIGSDWITSILGLVDKLDDVDAGLLRPAHDTFYDPR
jgi:hypothetical protein